MGYAGVGTPEPVGGGVAPRDGGVSSVVGDSGVEADSVGEVVGVGEELIEARTETTATFATGEEGVFRTEVFPVPVHVADPLTGAMVAVDTSLVPAGEGTRTRVSPVPVTVAGRGDAAELVSVRFEDGTVAGFGVEGAGAVRPAVEDAVATFEGIVAGADVVVEATVSGVKEQIVLGGPEAPGCGGSRCIWRGCGPRWTRSTAMFCCFRRWATRANRQR